MFVPRPCVVNSCQNFMHITGIHRQLRAALGVFTDSHYMYHYICMLFICFNKTMILAILTLTDGLFDRFCCFFFGWLHGELNQGRIILSKTMPRSRVVA